jgi:hypothetical protein
MQRPMTVPVAPPSRGPRRRAPGGLPVTHRHREEPPGPPTRPPPSGSRARTRSRLGDGISADPNVDHLRSVWTPAGGDGADRMALPAMRRIHADHLLPGRDSYDNALPETIRVRGGLLPCEVPCEGCSERALETQLTRFSMKPGPFRDLSVNGEKPAGPLPIRRQGSRGTRLVQGHRSLGAPGTPAAVGSGFSGPLFPEILDRGPGIVASGFCGFLLWCGVVAGAVAGPA